MKNKFIITFAGPMGSSKTPIAYYLSCKLNLPVFNNDGIRHEVIADTGSLDVEEWQRRIEERAKDILGRGISFIYDASMDREWSVVKKNIEPLGYQTFVISMDLGREFLTALYGRGINYNEGYSEYLDRIDETMADHKSFLENYADEVNLSINDKNFADRLEVSYEEVGKWLRE